MVDEAQKQQFLLFDKYSYSDVVIKEAGLKPYINLTPMMVIDTAGIHANKPFGKMNIPIVERLVNIMMRSGKYTGKKSKAYRTVREAFDIIYATTKKNPIQVLVDAIAEGSPREEVTRLQYGGISVPKAVDSSVYRRINIALRNIVIGAIEVKKTKNVDISKALANELIMAASGDMNSYAITKKSETERVAASAR